MGNNISRVRAYVVELIFQTMKAAKRHPLLRALFGGSPEAPGVVVGILMAVVMAVAGLRVVVVVVGSEVLGGRLVEFELRQLVFASRRRVQMRVKAAVRIMLTVG